MKLDNELLQERLWPAVEELLGDDHRLAEMGDRARDLFVPDAAERIAGEILQLAGREDLTGRGVEG